MAEIYLYDDIVPAWAEEWGLGVSAQGFLSALNEVPKGEAVTVRINSYGGAVDEARAIFNAIKRRGSVTAEIDGVAGSAASFVAMAAKTIRIAENAEFYIHRAMGMAWTYMYANELRDLSDELDRLSDLIADMYAGRSGSEKQKFIDLMDGDGATLSAQESVDLGLADEIAEETKFDVLNLRRSPAEAMNSHKTIVPLSKAALAARIRGNFAKPTENPLDKGTANANTDGDEAKDPKPTGDEFNADNDAALAEAELQSLRPF